MSIRNRLWSCISGPDMSVRCECSRKSVRSCWGIRDPLRLNTPMLSRSWFFFKATSAKPVETNALITTRGGHEISLSLVSQGKSDRSEPVDYVLYCETSPQLSSCVDSSHLCGRRNRERCYTESASQCSPREDSAARNRICSVRKGLRILTGKESSCRSR